MPGMEESESVGCCCWAAATALNKIMKSRYFEICTSTKLLYAEVDLGLRGALAGTAVAICPSLRV